MKKEKRFKKFVNYLTKLDAVNFLGLARLLEVPLENEIALPRTFVQVLDDVMDRFLEATEQRQKELYKLVKAASKARGVEFSETKNGGS